MLSQSVQGVGRNWAAAEPRKFALRLMRGRFGVPLIAQNPALKFRVSRASVHCHTPKDGTV
jgi:hypothetical protein